MECLLVLVIQFAVSVAAYYQVYRKSRPRPSLASKPKFREDLIPLGPQDGLSLTQAYEGSFFFGAPGSGKTSGSGAYFARHLFEACMGGLITLAKPTDKDFWLRLAQVTGRSKDLIIVSAEGSYRFDAFEYESSQAGVGGGLTTNLLRLVKFTLDISDRGKEKGGGSSDGYWQRAAEEVSGNAMDLCLATRNKATLPMIAKVIESAPRSVEELTDPRWQRDSYCFQAIAHGHKNAASLGRRRKDFEDSSLYFLEAFPHLADKTRSIIVSHFSGMVRPLLRYPVRDIFFDGQTNIDPVWSRQGKIFLLDFAVKQYLHVGAFVQALFKFAWQTAMDRSQGPDASPVFLFADECHLTLAPVYDREYFSTSRSVRSVNILITQNLSTLYATIPNRDEVDSILGNFATKVFHQNGCEKTNQYAADIISKDIRLRRGFSSGGSTQDGMPGPAHTGINANEQWEHRVPPIAFTRLKKGGAQYGFETEAIISGPQFSDGRNFARCSFFQEDL